jgi:hypothetical protein
MNGHYWINLHAANGKLENLLKPGNNDGLYWNYMDLLAIRNVIGSVLTEMYDDLEAAKKKVAVTK